MCCTNLSWQSWGWSHIAHSSRNAVLLLIVVLRSFCKELGMYTMKKDISLPISHHAGDFTMDRGRHRGEDKAAGYCLVQWLLGHCLICCEQGDRFHDGLRLVSRSDGVQDPLFNFESSDSATRGALGPGFGPWNELSARMRGGLGMYPTLLKLGNCLICSSRSSQLDLSSALPPSHSRETSPGCCPLKLAPST